MPSYYGFCLLRKKGSLCQDRVVTLLPCLWWQTVSHASHFSPVAHF